MPNRFGTKYDFAGQIINKLRVERYIGKSRWECTCLECGKITNKTSKDLETKRAYSCGCCTRYTDVDLTGQQFEKLIAQYRVKGKDGRILWHCTCSCNSGKTVDVRASDLLKGKVKSCGCMKHRNKAEDLIGKTFGRLKVIAREPNDKDGRAVWKCKCECGNETIVTGKRLLNSSTKSCGCLKHLQKHTDLTNKRFGNLVAISYTKKNDNRSAWLCKCDCGNEIIVLYDSLVLGRTTSCGCLNVAHRGSKTELEIRDFVEDLLRLKYDAKEN